MAVKHKRHILIYLVGSYIIVISHSLWPFWVGHMSQVTVSRGLHQVSAVLKDFLLRETHVFAGGNGWKGHVVTFALKKSGEVLEV